MGIFHSKPAEPKPATDQLRIIPREKKRIPEADSKIPPRTKEARARPEIPPDVLVNPATIDDPHEDELCGLYIDGLGFHETRDKLEKLLVKLGVQYRNVSKKKEEPHARIFFNNNEERAKAYSILSTYRHKNHVIYVVPLKKKYEYSRNLADKRRLIIANDLAHRDIRDKITPWYKIDYPEQLRQKSLKFTKIIEPIIPAGSGLVNVLPAPDPNNPRNKIELTVARDLNGEIAVGYMLGSQKEDIVAPINNCLNIPEGAPELAELFRQYVVSTNLPPFDRCIYQGVFKYVIIRQTRMGMSMISAVTFGELPEEAQNLLKSSFESKVQSISYIETHCGEGLGKDYVIHHLSGPMFIQEDIRGIVFDISPVSFFQTNTLGAELLFSKIEELCEVDNNTVLIDVCCGTGVIGLSMARKCHYVVGIDIEPQAIEDAKRAANSNSIQNCEFIASPAENVLNDILQKYDQEDVKVVAIVDPPRVGIHKKAALALRDSRKVKKLIYVSCNSDSLVHDSQKYLMAETLESQPFKPQLWFGVDMFPNTDRCELVMLMTRE